ncbi:MAG: hypothetical protein CL574_03315 [Altererythrobacter sp.]|nr:hypothetical protein [Erythrobacter sp.]MAW90115.1 hypothetical protein [Altererythrobacter sp.]|tara:strand:+ start:388 stop:918 length:531 start_codon:yes stop_codon:yes gene_type:complete
MPTLSTLLRLAVLPGLAWSSAAFAEPGNSAQGSGAAAAEVADPISIQRQADLRFGRFASPSTPSTIQITPGGAFNPAGDVASSTQMAQPANGRGPAQFRVQQAGNRGGTVRIPRDITLRSGGNTMDVTNVEGRLTVTSGWGRFSVYRLDLGGTLQIKGNQAPGSYIGEFDITVVYN